MMATIRSVFATHHVANMLGEDPDLLDEILSNDDNLSHGRSISVVTGPDETITALARGGIDELTQMLAHVRRSPQEWERFIQDCVADPEIRARIKARSSR